MDDVTLFLLDNLDWMAWNIFLAFVPWAISWVLFRQDFAKLKTSGKALFILGAGVFILFLPNAPYVLTDVIHLIRQVRYSDLSNNEIVVFLIPQYFVLFAIGVSFYVLALRNLYGFLQEFKTLKDKIWIVKLLIPLLMSMGIYLGRFYVFNSWDVVTDIDNIVYATISSFSRFYAVFFFGFTSVLLFVIYEVLDIYFESVIERFKQMGTDGHGNKRRGT